MTLLARRIVATVIVVVPLGFATAAAFADPAPTAATTTTTTTTRGAAPAAPTPPTAPATATVPADPFPAAPPTAPAAGSSGGGSSGPGFFDIAGHITQAINDWFAGLVNDALHPVLDLVGATVLSTPDFTTTGRVRDLWFTSWGIANALFILLVIAAGALAIGYETFQTAYAVKDLVPRLAFGWVAANASLEIAHLVIGAANALTGAFVGQDPAGAGSLVAVGHVVIAGMAGGGIFVTLIALAIVVLAVGLLGVYVGRVATIVILAAGAPLFLAGAALPQTEGAARLWWRAMVGCLAVQVAQALVLITAVRVFFDADGRRSLGLPGGPLMDLVVVGCLFWLMLRIPSYAKRLVFNNHPHRALTVAKTYVVTQGLRAAKAAAVGALG